MASSAPAWLAHNTWDPKTSVPHPLHPHHCTSTSRMEGSSQNVHWPSICSPWYLMLQRRLCGVHFQAIRFVSPRLQVCEVCLVFLWKPTVKLNAMTCFRPARGSSPGGHRHHIHFPQMLFPRSPPLQVRVAMVFQVLPFLGSRGSGLGLRLNFWASSCFPHWSLLLHRKR